MIVSKLIKILKSFLSQNIKIIYHQPATNTRFFFSFNTLECPFSYEERA